MYTLILILIFIVCLLLVLIVLVQNSKGGGLASNFQASTQIAGVRKTADFLEKSTWGLAGALLFLSIAAAAFLPRAEVGSSGSIVQEQIQNVAQPNQVPIFPTAVPDGTSGDDDSGQ